MKAKLLLISRIAVSVGLVAFLVWSMRGHFPRIAETLKKANPVLFFSATLLFIVNISSGLSARLKLLFAGENLDIAFGRVVQLTFIGYFFNNFMPTAVGGDIVKAYYASKETKKTAKSFIAVFMDRFIGLFSFVSIAAVSLLWAGGDVAPAIKKIVLLFALGGILIFIFALNKQAAKFILVIFSKFKLWNLGEKLSNVYRAVHDYKNKKRVIAFAILISAAVQGIYFAIIYILTRALGANVALVSIFLVMPIVSVISMLPSIGGLGLREGAIVAFFTPLIGSESAFALSILLLAMLLVVSLVGGIIYASASQFKIKPKEMEKLETYQI